jgi:glycoside/pentoside/hexuronide:cation symporter, GPH family
METKSSAGMPEKSEGAGLGAPLSQVLGYGFGDIAFSFFFQAATFWLIFFYTDVLGIPAATAGWIYMGALLWDAAIDPLIGAFAERVRTRHGRYRPFILFGAIPVALTFALLWFRPGLSGWALIGWAVVVHVLFRTTYAFVTIPYTTLPVRMVRDTGARAKMIGIKLVFTTVAGLFAGALVWPIVQMAGAVQKGATATPDQLSAGFWAMGLGAALVGLVPMLVCFALTREPAEALSQADEAPPPPMAQRLAAIGRNGPYLVLLGLMLASTFSNSVFGAAAIYHFKYVVGDEEQTTIALTMTMTAAGIAAPFWGWIQSRLGVRVMWVAGMALSLTGLIALFALPQLTGNGMLALFALVGLGASSSGVGIFSVIGDCVEYGDMRTGVRNEALLAGILILVQKVAAATAAGAVGMVLAVIGFEANVAQTPAAKEGIRALFMLGPATMAIVGVFLVLLYRLDARRLAQVRAGCFTEPPKGTPVVVAD